MVFSNNHKISVLLLPVLMAFILTIYQVYSAKFFFNPYSDKVIITHLSVAVIYFVLFIKVQFFSDKGTYFQGNGALVFAGCIFLCLYLANGIYSSGWQSLNPIIKINNGTVHQDILYMSSVAESFRTSIVPRFLINYETDIHYHTFSNFVLNIIGVIENIPDYFSYNYFMPVFFFPLYLLAQVKAISSAKDYFRGRGIISITDLCVLLLFNEGIVRDTTLNKFAIWKSSSFGSESFLLANTIALFLIFICFKMIRQSGRSRILKYGIIPAFLFVISWSKISTGFVLTVIIMYYILRRNSKRLSSWVTVFYYGIVFMVCMVLFRGMLIGGSGNSPAGFELFSFVSYCDGYAGLAGHYLILAFTPLLFIIKRYIKNRYTVQSMYKGETVWEELAVMLIVCSFLPSILLRIGGGSAGYFTYIAEIFGIILFCGDEVFSLERIWEKRVFYKLLSAVLVFYCFAVSFVNLDENPIKYAKKERPKVSSLFENAMEIRNEAETNAGIENTVLFIGRDSDVLKVYQDYPISGIYLYSALTGIGTINASYIGDDGLPYTSYGKNQINGYGLRYAWPENLDIGAAQKEAAAMGKKVMIVLSGDGYYSISLEAGD